MALHYVVKSYSIFSSDETFCEHLHFDMKHIMTAAIWRKSGMSTHLQLAQVVQTLVTVDSHYPISTVFREADCVIHSIEIIWWIALSTF